METKVIETKLRNVFNSADQNLGFDVNTPQFLKEACEDANGGMYAVCYNIFKGLLAQVAERATELHDPVLDALMIRLNLYEVAPKERYVMLAKLAANYDAAMMAQKHQKLMEARKDAIEASEKLAPRKQEDKELDKASEEYAYTNWQDEDYHDGASEGLPFDPIGHTKKTFEAGANWRYEKMMRKALDGKLVIGDEAQLCVPALSRITRTMDDGDRVKVLVLKREA